MWSTINNKVFTLDKFQKKNKCGLGHCSLCELDDEFVLYLLISCSYTIQLWKEIKHSMGISNDMDW